MAKGTNASGEQSFYIYNGLGHLVGNEWVVHKNAYGYTGAGASPSAQVNGLVVCALDEPPMALLARHWSSVKHPPPIAATVNQ